MTVWQYREATGYGKDKASQSQEGKDEQKEAYPKKGKRSRVKDVDESADVEADSG